MNRIELLEKILETENKKFDLGSGIIAESKESDGTIHFYKKLDDDGGKFSIGFLMGRCNDFKETYLSYSLNLEDAQRWVDVMTDLATALEVGSIFTGAKDVVRTNIVTDVATESKLQGQIIAYENILLGRGIELK